MKIGFLIIASEVLDGKISDLNTKILADFLRIKNLEIYESQVCRDVKELILSSLTNLSKNCDLIITSGGLGPTKDDITKETLGTFYGKKLIFNDKAEKISEENYKRFDRPFPGKDHGYCYLPEDFVPLSNSTGFAPGFYFEQNEKMIFSGPGVPREFRSMLVDHLSPWLEKKFNRNEILDHVIARTKNVPEEKIFNEVDPTLWRKLEAFGDVSSLPILMGVDVGVKLKASSNDEMAEKVKAVKEIFENSPIRENIWHFGTESIEEKIVTLANQKKIRFGFAESATGGLCSHRITSISGSSQCFMGTVVCYDEKIKEHVLGVKKETLDKHTAVAQETALEMAQGLLEKFNVDIAISITGYAGPGGGNDKYPVGGVCIGRALRKSERNKVNDYVLKGDREILKQRFSQAVMYALLEEVENFA